MIVCSCNVLTDRQILAALRTQDGMPPRSPGEAYRCLGCAPRCGRCVSTVRKLLADNAMADSSLSDCKVGCGGCPGGEVQDSTRTAANDDGARPAKVSWRKAIVS